MLRTLRAWAKRAGSEIEVAFNNGADAIELGPVDKPDSRFGGGGIQRCFLGRGALIRGLVTDAGGAVFAPFLVQQGSRGGRPPRDPPKVLDSILWGARTGSP